MASVMELMNLNGVLDQYEEEDKKSISLWGTQEKNPGPNISYTKINANIRKPNTQEKLKLSNLHPLKGAYNVLTIDKQCQSCTNHNPSVLSAFKMACLAYIPSTVTYKGQSYKREYLHEQKINYLYKISSTLTSKKPWSLSSSPELLAESTDIR